MSVRKAVIMDSAAFERTLTRLAHEIIEHENIGNLIIVGIKRRGVPLSRTIAHKLEEISGAKIPTFEIDISFYRDDLVRNEKNPVVNGTDISLSVEGKTVILIDDVIYTGRTARAAIEAVIDLGRPSAIRLCVLIDRGHRELPIRPDYVGKNIPTSRNERVSVLVPEIDGEAGVILSDL